MSQFSHDTISELQELKRIKTVFTSTHADYEEAMRAYSEFKRLRKSLGKDSRRFIDPDRTRKDLSAQEFFTLVSDVERRKAVG